MKKLIYLSFTIFAILVFTNNKTVSTLNISYSDSTEYCIVGGERIEGSGIQYKYLNKDIKFCCQGCQQAFKKNPAKYLTSAGIRCPVCDEDDAKKDLSFMNKGVKYYFCGKGCKTKFSKDPETYLKKYQE